MAVPAPADERLAGLSRSYLFLAPFMNRNPQVKDRALEGLAGTIRWAGSVMALLATRSLAAMTE